MRPLALLAASVLALLGATWLGLNLPAGQRALAGLISSDSLRVEGIGGSLPSHPRIAHVTLRDRDGPWLDLETLALDWSPWGLLRGRVDITSLTAARVHVLRRPISQAGTSSGVSLPLRIVLARLDITDLTLDAPVADIAARASATGAAELLSEHDAHATIALHRLDAPGEIALTLSFAAENLNAQLHVSEPSQGVLAHLTGLPEIGAITAEATLAGPRDATHLSLTASAGPLQATAAGLVNIQARSADLAIDLTAPAMSPAPDIVWQALALHGTVRGSLDHPIANGTLAITALRTADLQLSNAHLDLSGNETTAQATGSVSGLRLPAPLGSLFAASPITLDGQVALIQPGLPTHLALRHPALTADVTGTLANRHLTLTADLNDLAPFADLSGHRLTGTAALRADIIAATPLAITATLSPHLTGGEQPLARLLGATPTLSLEGSLAGPDIILRSAHLHGSAIEASATGSDRAGQLALDWTTKLPDLSHLAPHLAGDLSATGRISGTETNFAPTADISAHVGTTGHTSPPLHASLRAQGLPTTPSAAITVEGDLLGDPIDLALQLSHLPDGTLQARIDRARWRDNHAEGTLTLPANASLPLGQLHLSAPRLSDLAPLLGTNLAGALSADIDLPDPSQPAKLVMDATDLRIGDARLGKLHIAGGITDPAGKPSLDLTGDVTNLAMSGATATGRLRLAGPTTALALGLDLTGKGPAGRPLRLHADGTSDLGHPTIDIAHLDGDLGGLPIRLLAPTRLTLADEISLTRTRATIGSATLDLTGRLSPTLAATLSIRGAGPDLLHPFTDLQAQGSLSADATLSGTIANPIGQIRLDGHGLRLLDGPARALPPATITATASLEGTRARLASSAHLGSTQLTLSGTAPVSASAALDLRTTGQLDLTALDPILGAIGARARGHASLDATISGTYDTPQLDGTLALAGGSFRDDEQGIDLTDITARISAHGDTLRIVSATAKAGPGSITLSGTVGILAPGMPLDLHLLARGARLPASDTASAVLDADITLAGTASANLSAAGSITIAHAEFRIPERMPVNVRSIQIIRPGYKKPPPPASTRSVGLDLSIAAPGQIFVRGRGVDAELAGRMHIGGTIAAPRPDGQLTLRRGSISIAGASLTATQGSIRFNGANLTNPDIDIIASSATSSTTATLEVSGSANNPDIKLTSSPELPQDEILAQLLFGQSATQLSPFQLAQIAQALAGLTGVHLGIGDPLDKIRQTLALDRLSVGGGSGNSTVLEAGRYVARGIYVGARQGLGGGSTSSSTPATGSGVTGTDTQGVVVIDVTPQLKLEGTVGTGQGANSVGVTYQIEY